MLSDVLKIVLVVGLPGSGKSTWLATLGVNPLSSDAIRLQLADDASDQTIHGRVFATMRYLLEQRLEIGRPVTYIDATNLTPADRMPFVEIARARGCVIEAIFFDVPVAICKARNAARHRVVPDDAMDLMASKLVPPAMSEGFHRIEVIANA